MLPPLEFYRLSNEASLLTPALLVYPAIVRENIETLLGIAGRDPARLRPHIKTFKMPLIVRMLLDAGIDHMKCSTTLELKMLLECGVPDILLAYPVMGAAVARVRDLAQRYRKSQVSVLVESLEQLEPWPGTNVGLFLDLNSGMNRTGVDLDTGAGIGLVREIAALGRQQWRGLHFYDGQISRAASAMEREQLAHAGYRRLMAFVDRVLGEGVSLAEVITSGTPAFPGAMSFTAFRDAPFSHRASPGTLVFNDLTSLAQLSGYGFKPAALVLSSVVSRPSATLVTCDAGHKAVSADAGTPTCTALGWPDLEGQGPSEEHLPFKVPPDGVAPQRGELLYLCPRHVCPTVNNFDSAWMIEGDRAQQVESVAARGHETVMLPLAEPQIA